MQLPGRQAFHFLRFWNPPVEGAPMFPVPNKSAGFTTTFASHGRTPTMRDIKQPGQVDDGLDMVIDRAAYSLRVKLEHMLENVVEVYDGKAGEVAAARTPRPLCRDTTLDFISTEHGFAIGPQTSPKKYWRQLALCQSCMLRKKCLQRAIDEDNRFGIWGGKMPRDRRHHDID